MVGDSTQECALCAPPLRVLTELMSHAFQLARPQTNRWRRLAPAVRPMKWGIEIFKVSLSQGRSEGSSNAKKWSSIMHVSRLVPVRAETPINKVVLIRPRDPRNGRNTVSGWVRSIALE